MNGVERKRIDAKEQRETDAAKNSVTWKAESGAQSSTAEMGFSGECGVGVNQKGLVEMRKTEKVAAAMLLWSPFSIGAKVGLVHRLRKSWRRETRWAGSRMMG